MIEDETSCLIPGVCTIFLATARNLYLGPYESTRHWTRCWLRTEILPISLFGRPAKAGRMANVFSSSHRDGYEYFRGRYTTHSLPSSLSISKLPYPYRQGMNVFIFMRGYLSMVLDELEVLLKRSSLNNIGDNKFWLMWVGLWEGKGIILIFTHLVPIAN